MTGGFHPDADRSLMCSVAGCGRRWSSDFGRRLCCECARRGETPCTVPIPLTPPTRHFADPEPEYVHDDTVPF